MPEIIVKLGDNVVQKYFFVKESMSIGRTADNQIVIENLAVSRNHARIDFNDEQQYTIEDLGSANGTYVNDVRVGKTEVLDRDVISVGKHKLYFYNQHASDGVRRPVLDAGDRTMLMDLTPIPQLTLSKGRQKGQSFNLNRFPCTIGRGPANVLCINDWFVSKQHAVIEQQGNDYVIRDLDSWRNTKINGAIIKEAVLKPGDEIQLGPTVLMNFKYPETGLKAEQPLRRPVEMQADPESAPGDQPEAALEDPRATGEEPFGDSFQDRPTQEAELDAAILAEALGNEAPEANETCPIDNAPMDFEDWGNPAGEQPPVIEQVIRAAIELEGEAAVGENSCPEPQNLESFTGSQPDDGPGDEDNPPLYEAAPAAVTAASDAQLAKETAMWEKALDNKSPVIRKQAMRRLKKLTGKDYDY